MEGARLFFPKLNGVSINQTIKPYGHLTPLLTLSILLPTGCVSCLDYDEHYILTFPNGYGRQVELTPFPPLSWQRPCCSKAVLLLSSSELSALPVLLISGCTWFLLWVENHFGDRGGLPHRRVQQQKPSYAAARSPGFGFRKTCCVQVQAQPPASCGGWSSGADTHGHAWTRMEVRSTPYRPQGSESGATWVSGSSVEAPHRPWTSCVQALYVREDAAIHPV